MKISEVSRRTGLTKRTIRYYLERGLIAPRLYEKNGKEYRDYSEEDIRLLMAIANLRRAMFSVEQIRMIQEHPELIPGLWREYISALKESSVRLNALLEAAKNADPEKLTNLFGMSDALAEPAKSIPLPKRDADPRFKYLDDIEVSRESRERDRLQYAETRYMPPPNLHPQNANVLRGSTYDQYFALGPRAPEFFPIKKKRTTIIVSCILLLVCAVIVIAVFSFRNSLHEYSEIVYNVNGHDYGFTDESVELPWFGYMKYDDVAEYSSKGEVMDGVYTNWEPFSDRPIYYSTFRSRYICL